VFEDYAEVKRMHTRPAVRGRGVAKALLYTIQDEVRRADKSVLCLETGTYQREAIGLYERMGFRPRGPLRPYAAMPAATSRRVSPSRRIFRKPPQMFSSLPLPPP
jgi:GNAT superfamily N-acetyltransferase